MKASGRLPPGQSASLKWPVLHTGAVPRFDRGSWDFRVGGLVEAPLDLGYDAFRALPSREVVSDFHCVTRWSTFDNRWEGVAFREAHAAVARLARRCLAQGFALDQLSLEQLREAHPAFEAGILARMTPQASVAGRSASMPAASTATARGSRAEEPGGGIPGGGR